MMSLILTVSTVNNWEQLFTLSFLMLFLKVTSISELMKSFWLWPYWKTDRNSLVTSFPSIHKHQHKAKANIEHFQCYLGLWYLAIDKMKLWQKFLVYAVFPATLLKKRLWHRCFTNFFEKHICTEHLRATDFSEYLYPKQYIATENKNIQKEAVKSKKDWS